MLSLPVFLILCHSSILKVSKGRRSSCMSEKAWQEGGPAHDSWSITGSLTSLPRELLDEASTSPITAQGALDLQLVLALLGWMRC